MYPVSALFLDGLTRSHKRTTICEVFLNGVRIVESTKLFVTDGYTTIDRTAAVRRRSTLTAALLDSSLRPLLAPFGAEIRVQQYIRCDNGAEATIPLGWFRISQPSTDDDDGLSVRLATYDRSRALKRARLTTPYTVASGQNYIAAIQALVNSRMSGLVWQVVTTAHVTPLLVLDVMTDPLDEAQKMADSIGCEFFFDANGLANIQSQPNPATAPPVVSFIEGDNCTIIDVKTEESDEPGYNGAVILGNPSTGAPVRGEAWDDNPVSRTFRKGPYGEVPTFLKSQYIGTQAQADQAAIAERDRVLGVPETVTFTAVPNPALDGGDAIYLRRELSGVDDVYVIDTIKLPYKIDGVMTVTARRRKTAS